MHPTERHCIRCGEAGPFANPSKLRCKNCDVIAAEERREYLRRYQRARGAAANKLIKAQPRKFRQLLVQELKRVESEAEAV